MLLYRARTIASRPTRKPAYRGNGPETRVIGRWFTSCIESAIAHRNGLNGPTEIIMVDVPDAVAESYRVATTPRTLCGIDAIAHSSAPLTDHVIPMTYALGAEAVVIMGVDRVRDVIDVHGRKTARPVEIYPPMPLAMAA